MTTLLERLERTEGLPHNCPVPQETDMMAPVLRRVQEVVLNSCPELVLGARLDTQTRRQLRAIVLQTIVREGLGVPRLSRDSLSDSLVQEMAGYGPIDPFIADETVSEVMVNGPKRVFVERSGAIETTCVTFNSSEHLMEVIGRIVAPLGRRIDTASPYVDARLPDGSRVNAVIPPLVLNGPCLTIRKFPRKAITLHEMVEMGSLSVEMGAFLDGCVKARLNMVISGGTGSGKTTTLGALCSVASPADRVITIEDAAELRIGLPHVVSLESRPANVEGRGSVSIRDLLRNGLRMRPDRIIIGEVRGPEAYDLLQALNTGHHGSMSTVHANSAPDALRRLENMVLSSGEAVPHDVVSEELHSAIDLLIHQVRRSDGIRRIAEVSAVVKNGEAQRFPVPPLVPLFTWRPGESPGLGGGEFRREDPQYSLPHISARFRDAGVEAPAWLGGTS